MTRDRVTSELHAAVLLRDRRCVLAKLDATHVCRDQWGMRHESNDLGRLTLEHIKSSLMMGRRAPSNMAHLVAMCGWANVSVPSKGRREAIRAYLKEMEAMG